MGFLSHARCPVALNSIIQNCMISVQSEHAFRKHLRLSPLIFICRFGSAHQNAVVLCCVLLCGHPGLSVFSQKYISVGRAFKGKAYKFCVLSADGLLKPTKLCARWFECISHWIGGPSGLELEQPQHLGEVVFLIVRLANIFPGLREAALSILIYILMMVPVPMKGNSAGHLPAVAAPYPHGREWHGTVWKSG